MSDERFNLLKNVKLKNSRGRKWVDLNDVEESSDENSIVESNDEVSSNNDSDELYRELDDEDIIDVDFDDLVKTAETTSDSTNRLAVMHFDFDQYPLSYLANIIKYALPKNGKIKSITKYPTKEYMERYHDDIKYGPKEYLQPQEIDENYNSDESYDSDKSFNEQANKVFRKYQISRLKFFYAVFEFDSIETADSIYQMLDEQNLGDTGLKLDLRYIDNDRKFDEEIPEEFLHLIEKLRPNSSSKFKSIDLFQPSCFSSLKVKDMWDRNLQREAFCERAFELSDNELSDLDQHLNGETESEFSNSEPESINNDENDGPKIKRCRKKRIDPDEFRKLFGLSEINKEENNNNQSGTVEEEEEIESLGEEEEEDSNEYVINEEEEADDEEEEEISESEKEEENDKKKQTKKISNREKMKLILKEKSEKKKSKQKEIRDYLKSIATEYDGFDEFLFEPEKFEISRTNRHYENAKLFLEMMKHRADYLGIAADFVVPDMSDEDDETTKNQSRKRGRKQNRKYSSDEPDLKKIKK